MERMLNFTYVLSMIFVFWKCELEKALLIFAIISVGIIVVRLGKIIGYLMTMLGNIVLIRKYYDGQLTKDEKYLAKIAYDAQKQVDEMLEGDSNEERKERG